MDESGLDLNVSKTINHIETDQLTCENNSTLDVDNAREALANPNLKDFYLL